jgi:hypothetical protein
MDADQAGLPPWGATIGPAEFADYMACFLAGDFPGFSKYYADDLLFEGRGRHFVGPAAVVEFYRKVRTLLRETITVRAAYFGECGMAAELETELVAIQDWPDFFGGPMKVGDVRRSLNFVFYVVRAGRFVHIRSANFAQLT